MIVSDHPWQKEYAYYLHNMVTTANPSHDWHHVPWILYLDANFKFRTSGERARREFFT
jgi:hypothetical protein